MLALQTMVFVAYNKVITAQYFTWYMCFLPLCIVELKAVPPAHLLIAAIGWTAALGAWLGMAYQLEFQGANTFLGLWAASLAFHVMNVAVVLLFVYHM
jgi:phosphatidylinositol glycan class M